MITLTQVSAFSVSHPEVARSTLTTNFTISGVILELTDIMKLKQFNPTLIIRHLLLGGSVKPSLKQENTEFLRKFKNEKCKIFVLF